MDIKFVSRKNFELEYSEAVKNLKIYKIQEINFNNYKLFSQFGRITKLEVTNNTIIINENPIQYTEFSLPFNKYEIICVTDEEKNPLHIFVKYDKLALSKSNDELETLTEFEFVENI